MAKQHNPQLLSVKQVLANGVYSIPAYQRNYTWGWKEISQLIMDVQDYASRNAQRKDNDYYIGTLVVYARRTEKLQHWEVVDGQQRLTTLSLLVSVLRAMHPELQSVMPCMPLQFECREVSNQALQAIFSKPLKVGKLATTEHCSAVADESGANSIWVGCSDIVNLLEEMNDGERMQFARFLLDRVQLLCVELPLRTDLNHYWAPRITRGCR